MFAQSTWCRNVLFLRLFRLKAVDAIRAHGPVAVYGFTSMLAVARLTLAAGVPVPPGAVAVAGNGGEILTGA